MSIGQGGTLEKPRGLLVHPDRGHHRWTPSARLDQQREPGLTTLRTMGETLAIPASCSVVKPSSKRPSRARLATPCNYAKHGPRRADTRPVHGRAGQDLSRLDRVASPGGGWTGPDQLGPRRGEVGKLPGRSIPHVDHVNGPPLHARASLARGSIPEHPARAHRGCGEPVTERPRAGRPRRADRRRDGAGPTRR